MSTGDNVRAEGYFHQALAAYEGAEPATSINVGIARIKLGRVLMRQKRYAECRAADADGCTTTSSRRPTRRSAFQGRARRPVADYEALGRTAGRRASRRLADSGIALNATPTVEREHVAHEQATVRAADAATWGGR